jgi:hypothetical protein
MDKDGNLEHWASDRVCNLSVWKYGLSAINVSALQGINRIASYPNPETDYIPFGKANSLTTMKIYNSQGEMMADFSDVVGRLNVSNLKRGMYVGEINDGTKSFTQKLVKK